MLSVMLLFCHPEIYSTLKLDLSCVGKDFTRVMWASWWLANVSFPALGNTLRFDWLHSYYVTLSGFWWLQLVLFLWQLWWTFLICLQDRKYLSLEKARLKKANLDWVDFTPGMKFLLKFLCLCLAKSAFHLSWKFIGFAGTALRHWLNKKLAPIFLSDQK